MFDQGCGGLGEHFPGLGCRILAWDMEPKPGVRDSEPNVQDPAHVPSLYPSTLGAQTARPATWTIGACYCPRALARNRWRASCLTRTPPGTTPLTWCCCSCARP